MHEYEFRVTDSGIIGILPCGEEMLFATEDEYHVAYQDEENEIVEQLAELAEPVDYPEDWCVM